MTMFGNHIELFVWRALGPCTGRADLVTASAR